ncbi:MAG: NAD(P)H-binding protein [Chloroflexi bacterium]|nr:NAD(P)H-binding protein [Chloroflexota bacterium]
MTNFLIYGSYGYTGRLIADLAVQRGHKPILAGRDEKRLSRQAKTLGLPFRAFDLSNAEALEAALREVDVVLHCAGPFVHTYKPMVTACLHTSTHYVDISGEIPEFEALAALGTEAKAADIMLLPGGGFDVVPSDCLAAHLKARLPSATHLRFSIRSVRSGVSRGTARSAIENMHRQGMIRRDGQLTQVPPAWATRQTDFGRGPVTVVSIGWGDVSSAYYSTGIPNIEAYLAFPSLMRAFLRLSRGLGWLLYTRPVKKLLQAALILMPAGPSPEQRANGFSLMVGEVADEAGARAVSRLRTPEGYSLTAQTAVTIVERILGGDFRPGFQTPSQVYGADFILEFDGVKREDL